MTVATAQHQQALEGLTASMIGELPIKGVIDTVELISFRLGVLETLKVFPLERS
jgi:hypothetical protein